MASAMEGPGENAEGQTRRDSMAAAMEVSPPEPDAEAWAEFARLVFTTTPSSAAAERVFSRLRRTFQKTQEHALEGLVEATLMAQCNGCAM